MITETILNKFRNNIKNEIIEETIHLPHNIKSVKVITHKDLDGVCSAITMVDQLKKQGIKNIKIELAQYSDKDLKDDMTPDNKKQQTIMTDFARVPTEGIWAIFKYFFSSDENAKKNKALLVKIINDYLHTFKSMSVEQFKKILSSFPNINKLKLGQNPRTDKKGNPLPSEGWKQGTVKSAEKNIKLFLDVLKAYESRLEKDNSKNIKEKKTEKITADNIEKYQVPMADLDMTIDHHGTEEDGLTSARNGEIGVRSPSECSDAARKYNPSAWSKEDLAAIDMIDSAGYTPKELIDSASLKKNFTGPNRKRGLAIIINSVIGQCIKHDEPATKWLILNTPPSLVSLYTNVQKAYKFNAVQIKLMDAIRDGKTEEIKELSAQLPKELQGKWWSKGYGTLDDKQLKGVGYMPNYYAIKGVAKKDFETATSGRRTSEEDEELSKIKALKHYKNSKEEDEELNKIKALKNVKRTPEEDEELKQLKKLIKKSGDLRTDEQKARTEALKTKDKRTDEQKARQEYLEKKDRRTEEQIARQEHLESKEGNFDTKNNFAIQHGNAGRFTGSLISFDGQRMPFVVKKYSMGLVQVSRSPMYKGDVDFFKVAPHVMNDVENYMRSKNFDDKTIKDVMDSMRSNSGGHETIYNLQGFDKIKTPKTATWNDKNKVERAEALAVKKFGSGKEHMKERSEYVKSLVPTSKEKINSDRGLKSVAGEVQDIAIDSFIKWTNKLYPVDKSMFTKEMSNRNKMFEVKK